MPYHNATVIGFFEDANDFVDESEHTINGKSFDEIARNYALPAVVA